LLVVASLVSLLIDRHSFYEHLKIQYMHELIKGQGQNEGEKAEISNDI